MKQKLLSWSQINQIVKGIDRYNYKASFKRTVQANEFGRYIRRTVMSFSTIERSNIAAVRALPSLPRLTTSLCLTLSDHIRTMACNRVYKFPPFSCMAYYV